MRAKQYGDTNGNARLTDAQASAIRRSKAKPIEIAIRYGISVSQVYRIRGGYSRRK